MTPCLPTSPHLMVHRLSAAQSSTVQVSSGTKTLPGAGLGWAEQVAPVSHCTAQLCHHQPPAPAHHSARARLKYGEGLARTPRLQAPGSRTCAMLPRSPCGSWRGPSSAAARTRRPNINGLPKCALIRQQAAWLTQRVCTCSMLSRCCRLVSVGFQLGLSSGGAAQETDRDRQY